MTAFLPFKIQNWATGMLQNNKHKHIRNDLHYGQQNTITTLFHREINSKMLPRETRRKFSNCLAVKQKKRSVIWNEGRIQPSMVRSHLRKLQLWTWTIETLKKKKKPMLSQDNIVQKARTESLWLFSFCDFLIYRGLILNDSVRAGTILLTIFKLLS